MTHPDILRYQMRLDNLFRKFDDLITYPEILSHWSRYLCILVSGYIEESVHVIFREYSRSKSSPYVANYVETKLAAFQNPKMGLILELNGAFNQEWRVELEKEVEGEIKDSINSIVDVRNKVAHGKDVGITPSVLKNYYKNAKKFVCLLETKCST